MAKSGAACYVARHGGNGDVAQAVLLVANVALLFEHAELGADSGIAGLIGEFRQDLADGGALQLIEDVHDLTLAAGEGVWLGLSRQENSSELKSPFEQMDPLSRTAESGASPDWLKPQRTRLLVR